MRLIVLGFAFAVAIVVCIVSGNTGSGAGPVETPEGVRIESVWPSLGTIGDEITITGYGFDNDENEIGFVIPGGESRSFPIAYQTGVRSYDGKTLRFILQDYLGVCAYSQMRQHEVCPLIALGLPTGDLKVAVYTRNGTSNSVVFHRW